MKIWLSHLELTCKKDVITVPFGDFSYFYGEMGAGKSSIARLVDYCFGGGLEMTPALQSEFVAVALQLTINELPVRLERAANANQVLAIWGQKSDEQQLVLPARQAGGVVLHDTDVEVLSDLLFHLAGIKPPKVRRSRLKEESDLERLSFRDLFWFCYLDQESMDNSFFHLEANADWPRRQKSRTVLGYLLGFNQQRVAELEAELEGVRTERLAAEEAAKSLEASLRAAGVDSDIDIGARLQVLATELQQVNVQIRDYRQGLRTEKTHAADQLSDRARQLVAELTSIRAAIESVETTIGQHRRHSNELLSLSTKFQRVTAARAVLDGVEFERCPRCTQPLPARAEGLCPLCGQTDPEQAEQVVTATDADLSSRQTELNEMIKSQQEQLRTLRLREGRLLEEKQRVDSEYTKQMERYDSAYLAQVLGLERHAAAITEETRFLERLRILPARVAALEASATKLQAKEIALRKELRSAREAAEQDMSNVRLLGQLFLDCLTRAKIPGFTSTDTVSLSSPNFMPEVLGVTTGEAAVASFDTLGSGGKKTLFKCCFAVAVHRLARRINSVLPTLLIIDSPMKNISERENRTQFEGFHELLYELAEGELRNTQFLLIDKEYCAPSQNHTLQVRARHMTVDGANDPPLIPYYRERPTTAEPQ